MFNIAIILNAVNIISYSYRMGEDQKHFLGFNVKNNNFGRLFKYGVYWDLYS